MSLIDSVKRHEGLELKPYLCPAGKRTIGYGHRITDEEVEKYKDGITKECAEYILYTDLRQCMADAESLLAGMREPLNEARKNVIAEMVFQLGKSGVSQFKRMLAAIKVGDYETAAYHMEVSRWHDQTPQRCEELAEVMRRGTVGN